MLYEYCLSITNNSQSESSVRLRCGYSYFSSLRTAGYEEGSLRVYVCTDVEAQPHSLPSEVLSKLDLNVFPRLRCNYLVLATPLLHSQKVTMSSSLVLLTGATGLVGFRTLRTALEHGHRVRAVVRSEAKADAVRTNKALNAAPGQLEFVIVPDFLKDGAFDIAVSDVRCIIHVASPVPREGLTGADELEAEFIKPAVQGTLGMFESARKAGTVERIVVTSSMVSTLPLEILLGNPSTEVFGPDYRADAIPSPYMNNPSIAYVASKIAALKSADGWVSEHKPAFDVIHIHPSFVLGRDDMTSTSRDFASSTNALALDLVLGKKEEIPRLFATVHVDDVALAHVRALEKSVAGNHSFLLSNSDEEEVQVSSKTQRLLSSTILTISHSGMTRSDTSTTGFLQL
jgi:nucleoside-diphosphate-sugar epimerase